MLKKYISQLATILTAAAKLKQVAEQAMRKFHDDDHGGDDDGDDDNDGDGYDKADHAFSHCYIH